MTDIRLPVRLGLLAIVFAQEAAQPPAPERFFGPRWLIGLIVLVVAVFVVVLLVSLVVLLLVVALRRRPGREDWGAARVGPPAPRDRGPAPLPVPNAEPVVSPQERCPECGADLAPDSPEGLCPQCLLKAGVGTAADLPRADGSPRTTPHPGPGTAAAPADLAVRFPQLEVLELLGQGGMGAVYKARQPHLDRLVALKVLPAEAGQDPSFVERFTREARALARLSHPHIVSVYDFGQADGLYYFLMEFVDGVNLRQLMQAGPLQPRQALQIIPQICDALEYAHDQGVVHRDIKPENILLDRKGRVKIADFGLAKLLGRGPADFTLTSSRQVMGTLNYMAPEQMERPLEVDHRADIYSLGVVFYELLTHELPLGRFAPPSERAPVDAGSTTWCCGPWRRSRRSATSTPATSRPTWTRSSRGRPASEWPRRPVPKSRPRRGRGSRSARPRSSC